MYLKLVERQEHYWMQVDDVLGKSLVYLTGDQTYEIPFEEKKFNLSPKAFTGEKQLISLRKARPYEVNIYRNLAENVNEPARRCELLSTCICKCRDKGRSRVRSKECN